uniref:Dolichyl-diphosphooligosaccharide--protein glycosyltransferase subunit KCP2 n=1 Tax=Globodera rostochiensis TaxID=31243 RepID=A0A914GYU8_GLORO
MAGSNGFSALLSLLVVLSCIIVGQSFKALLAESRQGNLAAGGLGSVVFAFTLTAISNLKMANAGPSAKCGLFECGVALFFGVLSSASIHRISITICVLFSAVLLFFLTGISHKRYDPSGDLSTTTAGGGGKKRNDGFSSIGDNNLFDLAKDSTTIEQKRNGEDCSSDAFCARSPLSPPCLKCDFPVDCSLGEPISVNCTLANCGHSRRTVQLQTKCRFCWQLEQSEIVCEEMKNCSTNELSLHRTTCRAKSNVICAGRRTFFRNVRCHWTSGHSWSKALFLSVTLGGFGVDRFYLGHWKSAIGKLFSFGGLGVWTLLDIVLIAIGYIQPADESLYI